MASKINDIIISYKGLPVTDYCPNLKKVVGVGYSEDFFSGTLKEERKGSDNTLLNIHILYKVTEPL